MERRLDEAAGGLLPTGDRHQGLPFSTAGDKAFQLLMTLHRPRGSWNAFTRTELALQQERYFQSMALANQVAGGQHKGLANLPKAEHIDVRREIANLAGVCPRNVSKVKIIRDKAHRQLIQALHNGTVKINRALQLCMVMQEISARFRVLQTASA